MFYTVMTSAALLALAYIWVRGLPKTAGRAHPHFPHSMSEYYKQFGSGARFIPGEWRPSSAARGRPLIEQ